MYRPVNRPAISVLVPYRPDNGWRDRVWAYLSRQWAATGWEVITGECPPGPWRKGLAVKDAAARASGDVLVVADADVTGDGLGEAVDAVLSGAPWAIPHTNVHRLSRNATVAVLAGSDLGGQLEQRPYRGVTGGGMVVLTRDALAECPMDVRFQGWGQEDQAWGLALTTLFGEPPRSSEPLWHLWHEPQDRLSRSTGSMGGRLLLRRYQAASGHWDQMCALLSEEGETRESGMAGMYVYRNKNNGQTVELPQRNARLDRLGNWELLSSPPEPEPRPEIVAEPAREHVVVNGGGFRPAAPSPALEDAAPQLGPASMVEAISALATHPEVREALASVEVPATVESVSAAQGITVTVHAPPPEYREDAIKSILGRMAADAPETPTAGASTMEIISAMPSPREVAQEVLDSRRPAVNEPKSRWIAYAQTRGVEGAETLTKTALIRACS